VRVCACARVRVCLRVCCARVAGRDEGGRGGGAVAGVHPGQSPRGAVSLTALIRIKQGQAREGPVNRITRLLSTRKGTLARRIVNRVGQAGQFAPTWNHPEQRLRDSNPDRSSPPGRKGRARATFQTPHFFSPCPPTSRPPLAHHSPTTRPPLAHPSGPTSFSTSAFPFILCSGPFALPPHQLRPS
jgi:hypothetical protein